MSKKDQDVAVLVLDDNHPLDNYLVGTIMSASLDDSVMYGKDKILLSHCVKMKILHDPETGEMRPTTNPILVCESLWVDLRHYTGIGSLKEPLRSVYLAWKKNYENHDTLFPSKKEA